MGMTYDKWQDFLEGLIANNLAPPEEEWMMPFEDFPYEVQEAMRIFYNLPNIIDGMTGYTGKDLSVLPIFFDVYEVPQASRKLVLEVIIHLVNDSVASAAKKLKQGTK